MDRGKGGKEKVSRDIRPSSPILREYFRIEFRDTNMSDPLTYIYMCDWYGMEVTRITKVYS